MEKWLKNIKGNIPHTNINVNIELEGKNLIVTGTNGSGKTSFLKAVYEKVNVLIAQKQKNKENALQVEISDNVHFSALYDDRKAVIRFFEEKRLSEIVQPKNVNAIAVEEEEAKKQNPAQKHANKLEQHLVNLISKQALVKENNQKLAEQIGTWFNDFENNLKILFEDESLTLKFDFDKFQFSICQANKPHFTFQTLSAGYRAIFDIYAELIMHSEYFKIMPTDLRGIVFIDEIDSHLHVSLQRLIFPFFTQSFPKIQFIVTTHSPFVLMSARDTVIFDLASNEPITQNLSYFTYSSIMTGLWHVKPISIDLEMKIREIAQLTNTKPIDIPKLRTLTDDISTHAVQ
ncbi:ATPase AAA [Bacteroidia bacterium]|nr:ATPase AAA [Bacteroidia bacterium]